MMGGFLRSVYMEIRTSGQPTSSYRRPKHAADRTTSRRAAAGSRRTKRFGPLRPGPSGLPRTSLAHDWPWNRIETITR